MLLEIEGINAKQEIKLPAQLENFLKNIVIVSDKLFSHLVNDNLEVRTSVRIDPTTGTAAEGALFTYEAIPRGTILGFEIFIDTRKEGNNENKTNQDIEKLIEATFKYLKIIGLGGLGTRGFGRIEVFNLNDNEKRQNEGGTENGTGNKS